MCQCNCENRKLLLEIKETAGEKLKDAAAVAAWQILKEFFPSYVHMDREAAVDFIVREFLLAAKNHLVFETAEKEV